jgi:hypothetical protein
MTKPLLVTAFLTLGLICSSIKVHAQWDLFSDLISQMNNTTYNQYFGNLTNLDTNWNVDHVQGNDLLNDLYGELENPFPGGVLDSTYLSGLDSGLDSLMENLPGFGLAGPDEDTLLGELSHIQGIFENNFDSLGGVFGQYQDSLVFDSSNWKVTILDFDNLTNEHFDILQDTFGMFTGNANPQNPHNFAGLIGDLFDEITFPDLELAFGLQDADLKYWDDRYSSKTKVIRIGSVPRFDREAQNCNYQVPALPIEPRWHVQASWLGGRKPASGEATGAKGPADGEGFNPLLLFGDFAMMATPRIGAWGNTSFRLITSLGIEFGTYAPAHRDYAPPYTSYNKGFATGFGPQAGAGFAMTTGGLVIYSLATVAQGNVLRCPLPYKYNSRMFEVGMRFNNVVNIRYSSGHVTWQDHDNRRAHINHQLTVGIILGSLHH